MSKKELWFDTRALNEEELRTLLPVALNAGFDAIMIDAANTKLAQSIPDRCTLLLDLNEQSAEAVKAMCAGLGKKRSIIVFSSDTKLLDECDCKEKGVFTTVKDKQSMDRSIELSNTYKNVIIYFESATNIPLELILAFSQKNKSRICKRVCSAQDGWIATMTMEMGSYAVLLDTKDANEILHMKDRMSKALEQSAPIGALTVKRTAHIGMGDRVCIDTVSYLAEDEGMIIGSTSTGGILVSSETHYLPYMDLRPFRVNAGAIHSYVWCPGNKTKYLSELRAGDEVLVINSKGEARAVAIGRLKIEKRPLLLIEAEDETGRTVNTIVQDDWHIRIILPNGSVSSSTELCEGSKVLGLMTEPGRHLGVAIDETIVEK